MAEEAGLKDPSFFEDFKEEIEYSFKDGEDTIFKTVVFFLAETKTKDVKISFEHLAFKWLPYSKALKQLTFSSAKEVLEKANKFLLKSEKS